MSAGASSYDQVPYTSLAFPQTHPDHLAAVASIFGLAPPDVASCRVLELGCAGGGNLVPMAFNLPGSEFVGVDHSPRQVEDARAVIRALDLHNISIEAASIEEVDASWGAFDYIICHGVFSWVDPPVQDRVLRIAGEQLSPQGIAYISYNTYPGWHMRQMARDMMRYHAAQFADAGEQVAQARALLAFLATAADRTSPYGQWLSAEAERASRAADSYVFHEHLERTNLPLYFHQFVARAEKAGLQFLSESSLTEMLTTHFPPDVAKTLERISPDILHLEQYMDFVRNRQFRQTLLCRADAHPRRALSAGALSGRLVSSAAVADQPLAPLDASTPVRFSNGTQRAELTRAESKAAFAMLAEAWPTAIGVEALGGEALARAAACRSAPPEEARAALLEDLFGAVMYGLVTLHTVAPPCTNRVTERPRAHPLARSQAAAGALVVNAHHQMIELDPFSRQVTTLADGRHDQPQIVEALVRRVEEGQVAVDGDELPRDRRTTGDSVAHRLEQTLTSLVRNALLVG